MLRHIKADATLVKSGCDVAVTMWFTGAGELDTMRQIFLQQGKEKFLSASSGGPVTWKQPTPPPLSTPSQITTTWPSAATSASSSKLQNNTDSLRCRCSYDEPVRTVCLARCSEQTEDEVFF